MVRIGVRARTKVRVQAQEIARDLDIDKAKFEIRQA
jgi:hypothetical protein